jgi:DNA-binding response OmpR family regulator
MKNKPWMRSGTIFWGIDTSSKNSNYQSMMQSVQPIMIVDDEPDITYIMKKVFQVNGIVADSFNDAEEALSHFKPGVYGLLILDIGLPKMNGFELYGEMRKIDAELKVCFLSAYETYGEHSGFPQTEIKCIFKKPIRMTELVEHVRLEIGSMAARG